MVLKMFQVKLIPLAIVAVFATILQAASITIRILPSNLLPNPNALPPTTHATIVGPNGDIVQSSIRKDNTIILEDISTIGSHLLSIYARDVVFANYRIDTNQDPSSPVPSGKPAQASDVLITFAAQTFPGTQWSDTGMSLLPQNPAPNPNAPSDQRHLPVPSLVIVPRILVKKDFYEERVGFNPLSLLKSPMVLLGIFGLLFTFGMPKLMENMDPEMKAEYEEMQKKSPTAAIGRAMNGETSAAGGFDLASYLAGSGKKEATTNDGNSLRDRKR